MALRNRWLRSSRRGGLDVQGGAGKFHVTHVTQVTESHKLLNIMVFIAVTRRFYFPNRGVTQDHGVTRRESFGILWRIS